jgi:hypothetical protein
VALRNGRGGCGALLYERLVRRLPTRSAPYYLERGSTNHLDRSTEKSSACAIAPDLLEQNILEDERYVAQTKDDVGRRENNMTQIASIKLGLIAICFVTVPLSLAQMPRTRTSGSNQTGTTTGATVGHSGLSGNSTSAAQLGTNFRSSTITAPNTNPGAHIGINTGAQTGISNPTSGIIGGPAAGLSGLSGTSTSAAQTGTNFRSSPSIGPNTNVGAHIGINAGAQTGISNQTGGIAGAAARGLGSSSRNSTGTTQTGTNARNGTNTTANTNTGAHTATAATPASVTTILPQLSPVPINGPSPNNSPIGPTFSTPAEFPSPSATPTPTPAQVL